MIPELVNAATGVDLVEQQIRAFTRLPVDLAPGRQTVAGIAFLMPDQVGP
ncbi:hypothetical protein HFP72_29435 [Nocardiopsis sp. ARC36]